MRKIILMVFLYVFTITTLFAEDSNSKSTFSISTSLSLIHGSIYEYVFDEKSKVSELKWDINTLVLAGTKIYDKIGSFKLEGSLFYAVNEDTGSIQDYDWNTSTSELTNYSKHSIKQRGSIFSDMNISYMIYLNRTFSLFHSAGVKFNNIQFTAEDGYLEYPPGSIRNNVYGKGIIYEQKYLIPYLGAGLQYNENQFYISLSFFYSQFARCNTRDSHVKRDIDFYDEIKNATYYNLKCDIKFEISELTSVSLNCGWTYIPLSKGSSSYIDLSTGEKSQVLKNGGGVKNEFVEIGLSINLHL